MRPGTIVGRDEAFVGAGGFLLTGTADLLMTGGLIPRQSSPAGFWAPSPRTRGMKQGLFVLLSAFLIVPLVTVFSIMISLPSPVLAILSTLLLVVGGLLRVAYAWTSNRRYPAAEPSRKTRSRLCKICFNDRQMLSSRRSKHIRQIPTPLPPRETGVIPTELEPHSITEGTTRLLENEELPQ